MANTHFRINIIPATVFKSQEISISQSKQNRHFCKLITDDKSVGMQQELDTASNGQRCHKNIPHFMQGNCNWRKVTAVVVVGGENEDSNWIYYNPSLVDGDRLQCGIISSTV